MFHTLYLGLLLFVAGSQALYDSSSDVVDLTPSNFDRLVTNSDEVWIVEFYAPWCGHCKNLVPEYKKAAKALKGIIKVGAVDADQHKTLSGKYGVSGFPTIKIFTGSKHTPYQGQRTADAFVDAGLKAAKERAYDNLGKKSSGGSGDKRQAFGHNIPWKKILRIEKQIRKPQIQKSQKISHKPLVKKLKKTFRKPIVQKLQKPTHNSQAQKSHKRQAQELLNKSETQVPIAVDKPNLEDLHGALFRSNDLVNNNGKQSPKHFSRNNIRPRKSNIRIHTIKQNSVPKLRNDFAAKQIKPQKKTIFDKENILLFRTEN